MEILSDLINRCTGCCACANACPTKAIKMTINKENTFLYPKIDSKKCIECAKCVKTCPQNNYVNNNIIPNSPYAVQAKNVIRLESSSGGAFFVLCSNILNDNGIIYSPKFNDKFQLKHTRIDSYSNLSGAQGSKYLQSDIGLCYQNIKKDLIDEKVVLFFGTPCQVAGLNNYLSRSYDNLYTVDIMCHGVPSQRMFDSYLKGIYPKEKPILISFRDKMFGWRCDTIRIVYPTFEYKKSRWDGDPYEVGFHTNITLRNSCEECKFASFPRVGDISIGDFWGLSNYIENKDAEGTSILFVNSEKGQNLFKKSCDSNLFTATQIKCDINTLPNRISPICEPNENKKKFFSFFPKYSFAKAMSLTLQDDKK